MKPVVLDTMMVRAILDDRKVSITQIVEPQPEGVIAPEEGFVNICEDGTVVGRQRYLDDFSHDVEVYSIDFPVKSEINIGDVLYVQEKWKYKPREIELGHTTGDISEQIKESDEFIYYETDMMPHLLDMKWEPASSMPQKAARIFLKVTDVMAERLQDITFEQMVKEGFKDIDITSSIETQIGQYLNSCGQFKKLWNDTTKEQDLVKYSWETNPWIWLREVERCEKSEVEDE